MAKPALLMTGQMMPLVMKGCEAAFEVHRYWEAPDRDAFLRHLGPSIQAICTGTFTGVKTDRCADGALPQSQDHLQLRRRLRLHRRAGGGAPRASSSPIRPTS